MAATRSQKVRLGIFVGSAAAVLLIGLVLLAGFKLGEKRDHYSVRFFENYSLNGLDVGSPVKYSGIRKIDPQDVSVIVVDLSLHRGTPIAEDSVATADAMGITGLKFIELSRGSHGARVRQPGEVIPAGPSLMDEITDRANVISNKIELLVDNLNRFTTPDMRERAAAALDNANRLLTTAEATVEENRANLRELSQRVTLASRQVESLTRDLQGSAQRANALLDAAAPRVDRLLGDATLLVAELRKSREQLDAVLVESKATLQTARVALGDEGAGKAAKSVNRLAERGYVVLTQSQEELDAMLAALRQTTENLSIFSQRIKERPSLLIMGGESAKGREESDR